MPAPDDLIIRNGTCVLPWASSRPAWGCARGGSRRSASADAAAAADVIDAAGLHVLPGLIDPHVHLRDPGDAAVESMPTGTKAAVLGGVTAVFDMPNTMPPMTDAAGLAWKQAYVERVAWCDIGLYVGATKANIADLGGAGDRRGVCAIKVFAGSSTGDLMVEDDASIEQVMRNGRRRIAFHSEDEYRLQARKPMFRPGDPYAQPHGMARRGMRLPRHPPPDGAGAADRPAGAYPARLDRGGIRLSARFPRHRDAARCW